MVAVLPQLAFALAFAFAFALAFDLAPMAFAIAFALPLKAKHRVLVSVKAPANYRTVLQGFSSFKGYQ